MTFYLSTLGLNANYVSFFCDEMYYKNNMKKMLMFHLCKY